ncbi:MAG: hypothetical protein AB1489_29070 [Acidobacteriota bacterium]
MGLIRHLQQLVTVWLDARPIGSLFSTSFETADISDDLLATITNKEPYRCQAIKDAGIYLSMPKFVGIGLCYEIVEPISIVSYQEWDKTISPLTVRLLWSTTMSNGFTESSIEQFERVALESNEWKIVSIWSVSTRAETLAQYEVIKRIKNQGK